VFVDQFGPDTLYGAVAAPLMLGHAMAPEVFLPPALTELGAECPTLALYLVDPEWERSPSFDAWLPAARVRLRTQFGARGAEF
jgi:FMN reductase